MAHVAYEIDPEVMGTVTVSLQNVTLGTFIKNVERQVEAVGGFRNGIYRVLRDHRYDEGSREGNGVADDDLIAIEERYAWIETKSSGDRSALKDWLASGFAFRDSKGISASYDAAYNAAFPSSGNLPKGRILLVERALDHPLVGTADWVDVAYYRPGTPDSAAYFRDVWHREAGGWRWVSREQAFLGATAVLPSRFDDVNASAALRVLCGSRGKAYRIGSEVKGRITMDLRGRSFERILEDVLRQTGSRVEDHDGVFWILPTPKDALEGSAESNRG